VGYRSSHHAGDPAADRARVDDAVVGELPDPVVLEPIPYERAAREVLDAAAGSVSQQCVPHAHLVVVVVPTD
jgi:hypothetical protein